MKSYHLRRRRTGKDREGGSIVEYEEAVEIKATIWPAGGKVQAEMYGERLSYIKNMEYGGSEAMQEVYSDIPDKNNRQIGDQMHKTTPNAILPATSLTRFI